MKLVVALGLNIGLLWAVVAWVRQQRQTPVLGRWLLPLLGLKLLVSLRDWLLLSGDALYFQRWGKIMTAQFWAEPVSWLHTLLSDELHFHRSHLVFHGFANTFFIIKVLSCLNLASLTFVGLNSLYLSLFCFVGCWQLVRALGRVFPEAPPGSPVVAFLLWPSVLYWTAGLTKESLLLGSAAWLLALLLPWLYGLEKPRLSTSIGAVLLAGLQFKMRFFFAGLLFGVLAGLALIRLVQHLGGARRWWTQVLLLAAVLAVGATVAGEVSPVFHLNKFTNQLTSSYSNLLRDSRHTPHIEYANLAPTPASIIRNTPQAIVNTLARPWIWEGSTPVFLVAGLENLLLLLSIAGAFVATARGARGQLPFALVLALLVYCAALAALIGLSTPNLGTLNRYRSVLLPFILLLALQNPYAARVMTRMGL